MAAKVCAFINFKGGVGKTSNVVNVGACLARSHRRRVLIVDLDAQCNASFWLLNHAQRQKTINDPRRTVCQLFRDSLLGTQAFDFEESVFAGIPYSSAGNPQIPTLDLLPASVELLEVEERLNHKNAQPYFAILARALKPHVAAYDYVFLDCPPNIYNLSKNALFFADEYIVPYIPDFLSLSGLRVFAQLVRRFQDQVSGYRPDHFKPRISGVIINRFKRRHNIYAEGVGLLRLEINDLKAQKLLSEKATIFEPEIRDCVATAECANHHKPVVLYQESSLGAMDYEALSTSLLQHFEYTQ